MKFSIKDFFSKLLKKFAEILWNGKLHFLCNNRITAEAYSGSHQTTMLHIFAKIVNCF